ncbi:hypothetical protein EON65_13100 [archaeon]|nr:MAG: hypothetical protein EON65_13100 [archaeon]
MTLSLPVLYWALFPLLADQAAQLPSASLYLPLVLAVKRLGRLWASLRARVPDELDRQHMFVANANTTKDGSLLMLDAAAEFSTGAK